MYPLFYTKMMGVNLSRLSLGAAMLAMALLALGCASTTSTDTSFESDLEKAQAGNAYYQYLVGLEYSAGSKVPKDEKKYLYWMRKSAEGGEKWAQYSLGVLYENGEGVKRDDKKAIYWYRKAADQGQHHSQYNLGVLYENGQRVKRDDKKAIYWYRKAAYQGQKDAQYAKDAQNALVRVFKKRGLANKITKGDKKHCVSWFN